MMNREVDQETFQYKKRIGKKRLPINRYKKWWPPGWCWITFFQE